MKFHYKAKKSDGELIEGDREASDRFALARTLRAEGEQLLLAKALTESGAKTRFSTTLFGRVKMRDKIIFASSLGAMIGSGLSLARALHVIERQTKHKRFQFVIATVAGKIRNGESFSQSLEAFPDVFPPVFTAMVSAGEESGNLTGALEIVSQQLSKSYDLRRKVKGAMIYPVIILCVIIIIAIVMMIFLVPTITALFKELNVELPFSTRVVIGTSDFITGYPLLFFGGLIVIIGGLIGFGRSVVGHRTVNWLTLRLPAIKTITREMNSAIVMRTLSSLISAGVSMVDSIIITKRVLQNYYFQETLALAAVEVPKGKPLSGIFKAREDIYPILVGEFTEVGEETGNLPGLLQKGAVFFEEEVNQATKNLTTIIEPALMVLIGLAVGFFAVSMIGPMYSLSNAF